MSKQLTEAYLVDLLNVAFSNREHFELIVSNLKSEWMPTSEYQQIINEAKTYWNVQGRMPTLKVLLQHFHNNGKTKECNVINDLLEARVPSADVVISGLEEFIKQNMFVELFSTMAENYNKGKKATAYKMFSDNAETFANFSLFNENFELLFKNFNKRNIERIYNNANPKFQQIPTGMDFLDEITEGGLFTGETELWLGDSGVGKSKLLCTRGIASARRGFNVLHVQIEGTREQCQDNYDACWTGLRYMDLKLGNLREEDIHLRKKIAKKIIDSGNGEVFIKTTESFGKKITFKDIRRWAREIVKKHGRLDHIIIDYLELMRSSEGKTFDYESGERSEMSAVAREFKDFCIEFQCLGTTVAQSSSVSPELLKQPDFTMTRYNIGKHKRLVEPFSYFFTINQTPDEKKLQIARVYCDKMREHQSGQIMKIAQKLECSRFYDRSKTMQLMENDEEYDD